MLPLIAPFVGSRYWTPGLSRPPRAFHLRKIELVNFLRSFFAIAA